MANESKAPKRSTYILRLGTHDGIDEEGNRKLFQAGDKVLLTEAQAEAFGDKFTSQKVYDAELKHMAAIANADKDEGEDDGKDNKGSGNKPAPNQGQTQTQTPAPNQK